MVFSSDQLNYLRVSVFLRTDTATGCIRSFPTLELGSALSQPSPLSAGGVGTSPAYPDSPEHQKERMDLSGFPIGPGVA